MDKIFDTLERFLERVQRLILQLLLIALLLIAAWKLVGDHLGHTGVQASPRTSPQSDASPITNDPTSFSTQSLVN
jgi:hypothetical protein